MRFEEKDYALVESLMRKAGQLGLLAVSIPEKYHGLGMGFNTGMLICEEISSLTGSVATAFGAHTGIGTLPILLYGTEKQKNYYLPKISSSETLDILRLNIMVLLVIFITHRQNISQVSSHSDVRILRTKPCHK